MQATENDFVDITSLVEESASSLTLGNSILCNPETFDLHDSMAALELLDSKLDCCEIAGGHPPRPFPSGLDDSITPVPWKELSLQKVSCISLQLLVRLESMLSGASVAESIFTCLYAQPSVFMDMQEFENRSVAQETLYATTLGVLAISKVVRLVILNADIYEEEDFTLQDYGMEFNHVLEQNDEIVKVLENAISCVNEKTDAKMVRLILQFLLDFFKACSCMAQLNSQDQVRAVVDETKRATQSALDKLNQLKCMVVDDDEQDKQLLQQCFDATMYRVLVGNAPVRKVSFKSSTESLDVLQNILAEMNGPVCNLLECPDGNLQSIRQLLQQEMNILTRSMLLLNLYFDEKFLGQYSLVDLVVDEIQQLGGVPDSVFESKYGQALVARLAKPVYDTLKLQLLNKNRQRAYMEAVMITDWASLQQEAHAVDVYYCRQFPVPPPPYLSRYVLHYLVGLLDHYIALGLQLKLYHGHHDLCVAYWYRDVLLSSLINTMTAMKRTKMQLMSKKGKKKKGGQKKSDQEDDDLELQFMMLVVKRGICRGISRFIPALQQAGLLHTRTYEFTTLELRFQKAFEPFSMVMTPAPLSYRNFSESSDYTNVTPAHLLQATTECFTSSKAVLDELLNKEEDSTKLRSLAKVCVGNNIFCAKLSRMDGQVNAKVEFDFDTNAEFCTVKII